MRSGGIFDADTLRKEIAELRAASEASDFWNQPIKAQATMRVLAAKQKRVDDYDRLDGVLADINELTELIADSPDEETEQEIARIASAFEADLQRIEVQTMLGGEHDFGNAILEISAGAGGTEACDWAQMLFRMYTRWAEREGMKAQVLAETPGDVTGYRSVTVEISGDYAYGKLRSEHGVHRLVRISPFDASNRRHTSFALVGILPEVEEEELEIDPDDLKVETFRASGAGGQHVNKTESAIKLLHVPTGISVSCQNERSQHQNRAAAMRILASRLAEYQRAKSEDKLRELRGELTSAEWGRQIRSYVMQPYQLVKDLRTNVETGNVLGVLDGEIGKFVEAFLRDPSVSSS